MNSFRAAARLGDQRVAADQHRRHQVDVLTRRAVTIAGGQGDFVFPTMRQFAANLAGVFIDFEP